MDADTVAIRKRLTFYIVFVLSLSRFQQQSMSDETTERIDLVFGIQASFHVSYTVSKEILIV